MRKSKSCCTRDSVEIFPLWKKKTIKHMTKKIQITVVERIKPEEEQQITNDCTCWGLVSNHFSSGVMRIPSSQHMLCHVHYGWIYDGAVILLWFWESCRRCPGRGSDQGKGCSSIWLALYCRPRPATCRGKVLLISKAGYLVWIQLSLHFQFIWPMGASVPLFELNPNSHQGLILESEDGGNDA